MTREVISDSRIGESYVRIMHDSGLEILIWKMQDFSLKHAIFGTRYGSVNTTFKTSDEPDFVTVPNGIAHYLEHKLFENEDTDVFDLYAKTGAFGNAYTTFDKTCYLFSCTDNFIDSLKILLKFVQEPYFTEETVAKEQGIIAQEIKMYQDNPDWRVFFGMLQGIYHENPVKIDIAGTVESIAQITPELLYRCYYTFYNLHNMTLAIAGDVDEEEILRVCDELLKPCEDKKLISVVPEEPGNVAAAYGEQSFEVAVPMFSLGFKTKPVSDSELSKLTVISDIALSLLADETSPLYKRMYDEGLILPGFSTGTFSGNGYFVPMVNGESKDPKRVEQLVKEEIARRIKTGFEEDRFNNIKKSYYGSRVRALNNADSLASLLINTGLRRGGNAFTVLDTVAEMTCEDARRFLEERLDADNSSLFVIRPKGGA
ncbi:MAG: insulinase family protein [Oscillospiraceae bacterium]|nr:insulinase family protein [Oscillospiraceae bacterium]